MAWQGFYPGGPGEPYPSQGFFAPYGPYPANQPIPPLASWEACVLSPGHSHQILYWLWHPDMDLADYEYFLQVFVDMYAPVVPGLGTGVRAMGKLVMAAKRPGDGATAPHVAAECSPSRAIKVINFLANPHVFPHEDTRLMERFFNNQPPRLSGVTPFLFGINKGREDSFLGKLLDLGADWSIRDFRGCNAAHYAAAGPRYGEHGYRDSTGARLLRYLQSQLPADAYRRMLLERAAAQMHGDTPAHRAARLRYQLVPRILSEHSAGECQNVLNLEGERPSDVLGME